MNHLTGFERDVKNIIFFFFFVNGRSMSLSVVYVTVYEYVVLESTCHFQIPLIVNQVINRAFVFTRNISKSQHDIED